MGRPKKDPNRANTRDLVLAEAERHLALKGYLGLSLRDIAADAGIRKASLYHHFPGGKDELVQQVIERALDRSGAAFREALDSSTDTRTRLHTLAQWYLSEDRQADRAFRESSEHLDDTAGAIIDERFIRTLLAPVRQVLVDGVTRGDLRDHDADMSAFLVLSLLTDMNALAHSPFGKRHTSGELADTLVDLLFNGISARPN